jgi:drug/metabolite transporter (DMT)-like permease
MPKAYGREAGAISIQQSGTAGGVPLSSLLAIFRPAESLFIRRELDTMRVTSRHTLLLVLAAFLWGISFVMVQWAVKSGLPVSFFLGGRFLLATIILLPLALRVWRAVLRDFLLVLPIGIAMLAANLFQTYGLDWTTAANSAFITGLNFVFTPILAWLFWRTRLESGFFRVLLLAFVGFFLLTWNDAMRLNPGDILTLFCAIAIALQILWIGRAHAKGVRVESLAFYQNLWVGVPAMILALSFGHLPVNDLLPDAAGLFLPTSALVSGFAFVPLEAWLILIFTAVACSALPFWAQAVGQQSVAPARVALIFTIEPLSGALFDYGVNGIAPLINLIGGAIVLLALILDWYQRKRLAQSNLELSRPLQAGDCSP